MWDWSVVPDHAARFENLMALHLLKLCPGLEDADGHAAALHYLRDRDGREVDFLVTVGRKPWLAVEAKLSETAVDPALLYFKEGLRIPLAYQVTRAETRDVVERGVRCFPPAAFWLHSSDYGFGRARSGNGGRFGAGGGFLASSSRTISIAFSSCGSLPGDDVGRRLLHLDVRRHALVLDDPAVLGPDGEVGRRHRAAVHQDREAEDADQAAPGALADQRAELELAEHPGQEVAARAGRLVDEHDLRPVDGRARRLEVRAVAHRPVAHDRPAQEVDVVVGDQPPPLNRSSTMIASLSACGIEVALEVGVAERRRCSGRRRRRPGPSVASLDLPQVALDPVAVAQGPLVLERAPP